MRRLIFVLPLFLLSCGLFVPPSPTPQPPTATSAPATVAPVATATAPKAVTPSVTPFPYKFNAVISNLTKPLFITHVGDARLFVVEQAGLIKVWNDGQVSVFLDMREIVNSTANERGLLGLAFHPKYKDNGFFFVYYTDAKGNVVVARYKVSTNANVADVSSRLQVLYIEHPTNTNHNGGNLAFGSDGLLYLGTGDGGGQGDRPGNAQNNNVLLGKIVRVNVDQQPFTVVLWAKGLRNPWRFSFDRVTGDLYIGDVGQNIWEEVNYVKAPLPAGILNFGWNLMEGFHPYNTNAKTSETLIEPIAEYAHDANGGCSVTGGYVYRGKELPEFNGTYFYGDYCTGFVWTLKQVDGKWQNTVFTKTPYRLSSFGEDVNGELFLVDQAGTVYKLTKR